MSEWYYRIKGATQVKGNGYFEWEWAPILTGFIEADTKEEARKKIECEVGHTMTMRAKKCDVGTKFPFFIAIYPSSDDNYFTKELKRKRVCKACGVEYTKHEKDMLHERRYAGREEYCSLKCCNDDSIKSSIEWSIANNKNGAPVVYRISNKATGKCYVGQTRQPFTLRWWQHMQHNDTEKFGDAIKNSKVTDWVFEVVEVVSDIASLDARERHHIELNNAAENGYNTN